MQFVGIWKDKILLIYEESFEKLGREAPNNLLDGKACVSVWLV